MNKRKSISTEIVSPPKRTRRESSRRASVNGKNVNNELVELIDTSVRAQKMRASEWAKEQKLAKAAGTPAPKATTKAKATITNSRKSVAKVVSSDESSEDETPPTKLSVSQQRAKAAAWHKEQLESPIKSPSRTPIKPTPLRAKSPAKSAKRPAAAIKTPTRNSRTFVEETESEVEETSSETVADIAPTSIKATGSVKTFADNDDELVNLWDHFWNAFGCSVRAILPWFVGFSCVCYAGAMSQGWKTGNDYSKAAVIVGIVYASVLLLYFVVLLPLILVSRTVDKALYSNGGTILTSSILEISILAMFVISSLFITSYLTTDAIA